MNSGARKGKQFLLNFKFAFCLLSHIHAHCTYSSINVLLSQQNQLARIDNSQLTHEDLNSGRIEGIAAIYQTENDNKVVTTVEISAGIKAKTFARVLEFLYIGNGIYSAHFIFFSNCVV